MSINPEKMSIPVLGSITIPQDEYDYFFNHQEEFDVLYFEIRLGEGKYKYYPISSLMSSREEARELLIQAKEHYPHAGISKLTMFFVSENDDGRQELIEKINQPTQLKDVLGRMN